MVSFRSSHERISTPSSPSVSICVAKIHRSQEATISYTVTTSWRDRGGSLGAVSERQEADDRGWPRWLAKGSRAERRIYKLLHYSHE